ncbi:MAG: diacylglycerol kinase family protein [Exiguobacterium marinum]|uniref:Diacylglycerol kinase family protein n=1 Tax=Exiguobacterium marinum TaxID=273528 RepID=A0ABY7WVJ3_9BACL|nr:diacylglycerol kinase family protein [Exiguobacterium marinum]WDH74902.1 diacylglycerol kinase family protein [Exiguobacterium marinum]
MRPFRVACEGILHAVRAERNMRLHLISALLVFTFAIWLQTSVRENLILLGWVVAVISLELMNTSIERAVDLVTKDVHPLAKQAKDVAAGAVLVASIGAAVTALIIFGPRLWNVLY